MASPDEFEELRQEAIQSLRNDDDMDGFFTAIIRDSDPSEWDFDYTYGYDTEEEGEISELDEKMIASILLAFSNEADTPVAEVAEIGVDRANELLQM